METRYSWCSGKSRVPLLVVGIICCAVLSLWLWTWKDAHDIGLSRTSDYPPNLTSPSVTTAPEALEDLESRSFRAGDLHSPSGLNKEHDLREGIMQPASRGRVIAEDGTPIPGATLSWTGLRTSDGEWEPAWQSDDWGPLECSVVWTTSGADGYFSFEALPKELAMGSVIWATHPGYEAGCLVLKAGKDLRDAERSIQLKHRASMTVRVEGDDSQAVAGAVIYQYGMTSRFALPEGDGLNEDRARRYLWRRYETDETGSIQVGTFPGEQVFVASSADRCSLPWRGTRRDEVVLLLCDRFTVGGHVVFPDWSHLDYVGERRITLAAQRGSVWHTLAVLRSVQDGPWGPVELPILAGARYRIHLEGSPIIPVMVGFEAPAPSDHLSFDLLPELGHDIWIQAIDEQDMPVPTAQATVWWTQDGKENFVRRQARPDGYINPWSFPKCTVVIQVEAPGYLTETSDPFHIPLDGTVEWILQKGGLLRGRCLHEGEPVEDFEIVLWKSGQDWENQTHAFHGRVDGSFEIDTAPIGDVLVTASGESWIGGEPAHAQVALDSTAEVTLNLLNPLIGRGSVVDAKTDEPIPTAQIHVHVMGERRPLTTWGAPFSVQQDGTFEIQGFIPGTNIVMFRAPGYAERVYNCFAEGNSTFDLGRVALVRPQALEIQLEVAGASTNAIDFTAFQAFSSIDPILPYVRFSSQGLVRFEDVSPGRRLVMIDRPDHPWSRLNLDLRATEEWRFVHRVAGTRRLTVEVVFDGDNGTPDARAFIVSYKNSQEITTEHGVGLSSGMIQTIEGVDAEHVSVDVMDSTWTTIATAVGDFEGRDELHLVIRLGGEPFLFHVVDDEGEPVVGATINVMDAQPSPLRIGGTTDANGECKVYGVPAHPIIVHVAHQSRGRRHGVLCDGSAGKAEIVLRNDSEIEVLFRDADTTVPDVTCRMVNVGGDSISDSQGSDTEGRLLWSGLSPGPYRLLASHPDCWPVTFEAEAKEEASPTIVQIRRLGNLSLEVHAANGLPVFGQEIQLQSIEFDTDVSDWIAEGLLKSEDGTTSDQRGEIHLRGLPRGRYRWILTASTGDLLQSEVEVPPLGTEEVVITLP